MNRFYNIKATEIFKWFPSFQLDFLFSNNSIYKYLFYSLFFVSFLFPSTIFGQNAMVAYTGQQYSLCPGPLLNIQFQGGSCASSTGDTYEISINGGASYQTLIGAGNPTYVTSWNASTKVVTINSSAATTSIMVRLNSCGCQTTNTLYLINSLPTTPAVSTTAATCSSAGTATITNYVGGQTYTFSPVGPSVGAGGVISGMTAGTSYTVTAGNGSCTSVASSSFSIASQLATPTTPTVSTTAATCSAAGTATISNYDGSQTYTFTPSGPTVDGTGLISGMTAGTSYTVTASNASSCTSSPSSSFSIATQLTTPTTPAVSTTAATCSSAGT
ncbi:MAG: hypothetical protein ACOVOV_04520, partial [Dolichospermum sp.]